MTKGVETLITLRCLLRKTSLTVCTAVSLDAAELPHTSECMKCCHPLPLPIAVARLPLSRAGHLTDNETKVVSERASDRCSLICPTPLCNAQCDSTCFLHTMLPLTSVGTFGMEDIPSAAHIHTTRAQQSACSHSIRYLQETRAPKKEPQLT